MAARQGRAPAGNKIGDIYSGDTVSGLQLLRPVANAVGGEKLDNKIIAYYWYQQSASEKNEDAIKTLKKLDKQNTSVFKSPATTPCTLKEVYGDQESQSK
jgi:TPR repeat protein